MPATQFICPSGQTVPIKKCLLSCSENKRCMFLPTLRAIAKSLDRKLDKPSITELLVGTREQYLKKTYEYAINPKDQLYAIHGTAVHTINENHTDGNMLSEERLYTSNTSGQMDLYGQVLTKEDNTLGDFKVTSSYKLMKALGIYKVDVPTGEVYKSGLKKGQPKTKKEFRYDGVHYRMDWAIQLNTYRMLLEAAGYEVKDMVIQALCRDSGLRIAAERGITDSVYLIPINKISDHWLKKYIEIKSSRLEQALQNNEVPALCSIKENWHGRKCEGYCSVSSQCRALSEQMTILKEIA